jgi:hypothetical protein
MMDEEEAICGVGWRLERQINLVYGLVLLGLIGLVLLLGWLL